MFKEEITEGLKAKGFEESIVDIAVGFKTAAPSSLEIEIMADFKGAAGSDYGILQRIIPGICVDICNRNQWEIPFQQV
ncbi:MAG: hypothetical protein JRI61_05940, partial [Deltaproteobacteria bacterium]|nr:hypothetical protein [Deltaproteobacteria bacterium]